MIAPDPPPANSAPRVLVVEDERIVAMSLQMKLEALGYVVSGLASSGRSAVALADQFRPDLVLMDIRLEGEMDGVAAASAVRERLAIPVVFLTAYSTRDVVERAKVTEPYGYILKPVSERELSVVIEIALYRHRMEQKLLEQKRLLAATLQSIGDGVVTTDPAGRVTFMHPVAQQFTGWPLGEATGRPVEDVLQVIHEQTGQPAELPVRRAIREKEVVWLASHTALVVRDGRRLPIDDSAAPILDEAGRVRGGVLVFHDTTERRAAEYALRDSEERLRLALAAGRMGTFDWDIATDVIVWSDSHYELFGFRPREIFPVEYRHFVERIHPADRPGVERAIRIARDTQTYYDCEYRILLPDGTIRWISDCGQFYYASDGRPARMLGTVADVTERKRAVDLLRLRDRAIRAVNQGIVITDASQPDNPVIYASPGFERMTGYGSAEVMGRNCRFLQGEKSDPAAVARMREAIRTGQSCSVELVNYHKDGTPFWNGITLSPVADAGGQVTHYVGVMIDVTERRQLEEQFRQAQKMEAIGRLASGVAHDFNNLLTVIGGYSNLMLESLPVDDPQREAAAEIRAAGERAANLTRHLLAYSRKQVLTPVVLDLNDVATQSARMLERLIGEDIAIALALAPEVGRVRADTGQIEQVLMNLAVNARDAMPSGGRLTISTATESLSSGVGPLPPGRYVRLSVCDTGVGIPADVQAHMFEPFFTTKPPGQGTGLGLSTVYGIVAQSGGHVRVTSAPGAGATFDIFLPMVGDVIPPAGGSGDSRPVAGTETVLLVEDEQSVRRFAVIALELHGYKVLEAETATEAIRLARENADAIQLLVTDVVMPEMGGRQLVDAIRGGRPRLKVLFMSGYLDDAVLNHGVAAGRDQFLHKPFTPLALARKVRAVLDARP